MKKSMYFCLTIVLCFAVILLTSCRKKQEECNMNEYFYNEYVINDVKTLERNLTKEYDLNDLRSFFKDSNTNESIGFGLNTSALMFTDVNQKYPVEILRTGGYSVYKVSQGGYFYVFWMKPFTNDISQSNSEPAVYFSSYLSSDLSADLFDSLTPGISTADDVRKIDPSFELSFLNSSGVYSYSYINNETILQIKYSYQGSIDEYEDLIVEETMFVSRDSVPSRYSALLQCDIP